jgi:hypothetical protein
VYCIAQAGRQTGRQAHLGRDAEGVCELRLSCAELPEQLSDAGSLDPPPCMSRGHAVEEVVDNTIMSLIYLYIYYTTYYYIVTASCFLCFWRLSFGPRRRSLLLRTQDFVQCIAASRHFDHILPPRFYLDAGLVQ